MIKITEKDVLRELKKVKDPEIGFDIVDLGLVYGVKVKGTEVEVKMTLTSLGCPLGGMIEEEVQETLKKKLKARQVKVKFVFNPPWTPKKMNPKLRASLGV